MTGCQKTTVLVLLCAVVVVFGALFLLLRGSLSPSEPSAPTPFVLHTPTSTATALSTAGPIVVATLTSTPTAHIPPTATPTPTRAPSSTPPSQPTATSTQTPLPAYTPTAGPSVSPEVASYLDEFVELANRVDSLQVMAGSTQIDDNTVDELRGIYRRLHEVEVPEGAEDMHLSFIIYVSVLEEKCRCNIFAQIHAADTQGQHYRDCESRANAMAADVVSSRLLPSLDRFLGRYSLTASELGLPY
jgi:hypothetical protein